MRRLLCLWAVLSTLHAGDAPPERSFLPDLSTGQVGICGPFWWGRAIDFGEDLRFVDDHGRPSHTGTVLWAHQFNRLPLAKGDGRGVNNLFLHGRNNLVVRDPALAFQVQPQFLLLNTSGAHNAKISLGYVPATHRFLHGDNTDLEHLAPCPRLVLFLPVRHDQGADPLDPATAYISTHYAAQSAAVLEFAPNEIIRYEWFADPTRLDRHILCDLVPVLGHERIRPGIEAPLVRFDLTDEPGGWRLRLERDGRDGLAGGSNPEGWDIDLRSGQPGARPYSVGLDPADSAWAMSLFSPGGAPADTSQMRIGLQPYRRSDDTTAPWPDRRERVRSQPAGAIPPP